MDVSEGGKKEVRCEAVIEDEKGGGQHLIGGILYEAVRPGVYVSARDSL